ncbi:MAG: hypothetical protein AB1758_36620, partial [Candidatus Eremiobacterota bacterium]
MDARWNHSAAGICRDALERIDKTYWWAGTRKRLEAAREALDSLERLQDGQGNQPLANAAGLLRTLASGVPEDERVQLFRRGLAHTAESTARAAMQAPFLAGLALAALPDGSSAPAALGFIAGVTSDPVAALLDQGRTGQVGLQVLGTELPSDPKQRAARAGSAWLRPVPAFVRDGIQREILKGLPATDPCVALLASLASLSEVDLSPGLVQFGDPASTPGSVGAAVLDAQPRADLAGVVTASLPPGQRSLAERLQKATPDDQEKALATAAVARFEGNRVEVARALEGASDPLASEMLLCLREKSGKKLDGW